MAKKVTTNAVASYNGHGVKTNKNVDLAFKFAYSELTNYIQLIQFLNEDVTIFAKVGDDKPMNLGTFRIKEIKVDNDGEGTVKFNSMLDFVNADFINSLVGTDLVKVKFTAMIEDDGEEEDNADVD